MSQEISILHFPALPVKQFTNNQIVVCSIGFIDLMDFVKFTYREPQNFDPFNIEAPHEKKNEFNPEYYQRLVNDDRTRKIAHFLLREINNVKTQKSAPVGTFSTSMILAADLYDIEENESTSFKEYLAEYDGNIAVLLEDKNCNGVEMKVLSIPKRKVALIVDGQHRLAGIGKLYFDALAGSIKLGRKRMEEVYPELNYSDVIEYLRGFQFQCTLLLNFDLWEQGRVFADVNFNQKPVNRSLYYDIFGSYPDPNNNEIYLLHSLSQHLNNHPESVLKGKIKMLGTGKGFFSQAFFVESLWPLFRKNNIWEDLPMDYVEGGKKFKFLPKWFRAYFAAVKNSFSDYWPAGETINTRQYKDILVKTTGMGALIKLVENVYKALKKNGVDIETATEIELKEKIEDYLKPLRKKAAYFFSSDGAFSRGSGKGLQSKLYKEMLQMLQQNKEE